MRRLSIPWLGQVFIFILFMNTMIAFNTYQGFFFIIGMILVDRAYYLKDAEKSQRNYLVQKFKPLNMNMSAQRQGTGDSSK
jgi:hypothetical protein